MGLEDDGLDEIDVRILECTSEGAYAYRSEIHGWMVKELPSVAMLQRRLEALEDRGYITYEFGKGYLRTELGTETLREYKRRQRLLRV